MAYKGAKWWVWHIINLFNWKNCQKFWRRRLRTLAQGSEKTVHVDRILGLRSVHFTSFTQRRQVLGAQHVPQRRAPQNRNSFLSITHIHRDPLLISTVCNPRRAEWYPLSRNPTGSCCGGGVRIKIQSQSNTIFTNGMIELLTLFGALSLIIFNGTTPVNPHQE